MVHEQNAQKNLMGQQLTLWNSNLHEVQANRVIELFSCGKNNSELSRKLFMDSPVPMFLLDCKTCRIIDCNYAAVKLVNFYGFLFTHDDLIGRNPLSFSSQLRSEGAIADHAMKKHVKKCLLDGTDRFLWKQASINGDVWYSESFFSLIECGEKSYILLSMQDVTKMKQAELGILKMNATMNQIIAERTDKLQSAVNELNAFNHVVSHDLKFPLREIEIYSRIFLESHSDNVNEEGVELLHKVMNISKNMAAMINRLLEYSKTTMVDLRVDSIDLNSECLALFDKLKIAENAYDAELIFDSYLPFIYGDKVLICQAMCNIFSNALKFSKCKGKPIVHVGCDMNNGERVYYIKDNGVGFNMEYAGNLFGIFERLHSQEEFEGSGIGLAIVKRIIEKHNGKVWIDGQIDRGAIVYFSLPATE